MEAVDLKKVAAYAAEDADIALRLADLLLAKLNPIPTLKKLCDEIETPLIDVLVEMEKNGIAIDPNILKEQSAVLGARIEELAQANFRIGGFEFNPDSPKQLAGCFVQRLKLPVIKKTKTGASTDVEVLEKLADQHKSAADSGIPQPGEAEEHLSG
jgi:DNA polymerase I